jgi:hypothetical protein
MLLDEDRKRIHKEFYPEGAKYFKGLWSKYPKVPSKPEIIDWIWRRNRIALVEFVRDPQMKPSVEAPAVSVYTDSEKVFRDQLKYGAGLLEGFTKLGHMCAWDGERIFDPRGYVYSYEKADKYGFEVTSFLMAVQCQ